MFCCHPELHSIIVAASVEQTLNCRMAACSDDESDAANAEFYEELTTANETEVQMKDDGSTTEEDETAPVEVPVRIVSGGKVKPGVRFPSLPPAPSLPAPPVKEPIMAPPASPSPAGMPNCAHACCQLTHALPLSQPATALQFL